MLSKAANKTKDWFFGKVHSNNLIYNTCWEDPRCDRSLLGFDKDSKIVMITSAGCNALDYLLDNPQEIHCVDVNYRQNALLEFKKALFRKSNFDDLFKFFGRGVHPQADMLYNIMIRQNLPLESRQFWDDKLYYFSGEGSKKTFYFHGTSGTFAWLFNKYMRLRKSIHEQVQQLLKAPSLAIQAYWYDQVEDKLFNKVLQQLAKSPLTLSMLGVPRPQRNLIQEEYQGGVAQFMLDSVRHVFTNLPIADNYFWNLYINGCYHKGCTPNYLKEANFEQLYANEDRICTHTSTIATFLRQNPGKYSHFVLLDHQDWLAAHDRVALEEEWRLILDNSQKGTKILLRSAACRIDFLPDFVRQEVDFEAIDTTESHRLDRVGTYGSAYVGVVH